ncbi:ArsC family reductase [Comamonas piscis]|jgi:Spx/MgsR family transcriptional regulator|uniref:ArsC family reductase n=2 Tax=Comamonas TaxID=283 RepID=A0A7G5EJM8_9BURK|nr:MULTISPECIES: ArsC family reductase [Comamonas]MCD2166278.1 ArsC family reductase [Comamonas koreensis]QMV74203.1 ArsC family reductase [Comamonas piscis]WSO32645.1 ArsC family reductase [Comamonas piscis]
MSNHTIAVYGIPNCSTVKKARTWLDAQGVQHQFHDFKKAGVPASHLPDWIAKASWEKLVNRQGTTWRKLDPAVQQAVADAESASALMIANPSVIKRPVVEWADGSVTVGFDEAVWSSKIA